MAKVKLELPEAFRFKTEIALRITDINYGRHLGNDAVLALMHEARLRFLARFGFSEVEAAGASMIMSDALVVYKAQAVYGDILLVEVAVSDLTRTSCDFVFKLTKKGAEEEVARGKTGIVFFDYAANRVVRVPEAFRSAVSEHVVQWGENSDCTAGQTRVTYAAP